MIDTHPHHDIIVAYLEGKTVQCKMFDIDGGGIWTDVATVTENGGAMPAFHTRCEYRIKPIPKPDIVEDRYLECARITSRRNSVAFGDHTKKVNIRLVFDGETMELKSAIVL